MPDLSFRARLCAVVFAPILALAVVGCGPSGFLACGGGAGDPDGCVETTPSPSTSHDVSQQSDEAEPSDQSEPGDSGGGTADLIGEWGCYQYVAGIGTATVNKPTSLNLSNFTGFTGMSSFAWSFSFIDADTFTDLYDSEDEYPYSYDDATGTFTFQGGGMQGLVGGYMSRTYDDGTSGETVYLESLAGSDWEDPLGSGDPVKITFACERPS